MEITYDSEKCPKTDPAHISSINRMYNVLNSKRQTIVEPSANPVTPKVVWMIQTFVQLTLHRTIDLFDAMSLAWKESKPSVAFVLTRAIMENTATLYDLNDKLDSQLRAGDFKRIHENVFTRIMGGRDKKAPPFIPNILNAIDSTEKKYEGFRHSYDLLSEFAHPNYSGMHGLYGKVDRQNFTIQIDGSKGINDITFSLILAPLHLSLMIMIDSIRNIEILYPGIWHLSDEDQKS